VEYNYRASYWKTKNHFFIVYKIRIHFTRSKMSFLTNFFSSIDMDPLVQFFAPYPKTEKTVTETEEILTERKKPPTNNEQDVDENELPDYVKYLDLRFPFTLVEHMKWPPLTDKAQNVEESCEHKSDEPENAEPSFNSDTSKEKLTMQETQAETVEPSYDLFAPTNTELPEPNFSPYSENVKQKQLEEQLAYKARFDEAQTKKSSSPKEKLHKSTLLDTRWCVGIAPCFTSRGISRGLQPPPGSVPDRCSIV
jgi:hypothetical protein